MVFPKRKPLPWIALSSAEATQLATMVGGGTARGVSIGIDRSAGQYRSLSIVGDRGALVC